MLGIMQRAVCQYISMKQAVLLMARELHLGGSERQMTEIALGLDSTQFEPHVATFRPQGLRGDELRAAGVPVIEFPVRSFRSRAALAGIWQLAAYIRRHKIRLVHSFDAPLTVYGMPIARYLTSARVVSSQRGHRELTPEVRKGLRLTDHFVDGIVVNCQYLREHLINDEQVPERLIHVCYNGIDLQQFCWAPSPRPASLPNDALVIGVVCALRPEKNLATLLDAFARVRPLHKEMKLAIVGNGPTLVQLQKHAKKAGVFGDCVWEPATQEVPLWLRAFDIFVLPSLNEAFSNSLMEAMACRCPVVASNVGGNPELVTHAERGLLFEPRDVDALADALRRLIEDTALRRKLAESGERFIHERFSRRASALRMAEIYDVLLASRRL
jgi:glycosyltransferase involved in cell wall biosynthesis